MMTRLAAVAASALAVSCAPYAAEPEEAAAPSETGKDCFFLSQVDGYTHAGRDRIHVSVGPGRTYEFKTLGICPQLRDAEHMGFDPAGAGTICRGIDVDLIVPTKIGWQRCPVSMIRRLDEKAKGKAAPQ
jgi:hypothetical protein